jgi:ATP-dependent protease HslVU (ClpYQ) peptidase subunit
MTCVAGAINGSDVWIGADAVSVQCDSAARVSTQAKVFQIGEFLIGSSGTLRVQQIMRYLFAPPAIESDLVSYMVKDFVPALRSVVQANGGEFKDSNGNSILDGRYLVGVRGRLFEIDSSYAVFEAKANYAAIGCADQEALAAMFTATSLMGGDISPEKVVERGLLAAVEFDTSIRAPFTILKLNA